MFQIEFKSLNKTISTNTDETILDGALRHKLDVPFGCLSGNCGSCKGKITSGQVNHGNAKPFVLSEKEKDEGLALFCQATPRSNLVVESIQLNVPLNPIKKLPSRVQSISKIGQDTIILELGIPSSQDFKFTPGQYIDILLKNGKKRSYSMANLCSDAKTIELHIRRMKGGTFTEYAFSKMKTRDIIRFEGPKGDFCFDYTSEKPVIFVASGTGFAPIKSILEQLFLDKIERPIQLYWGGRRPQDLYLSELAQKWSKEHQNFSFVPVISEATPQDSWEGRSGFVHLAVMEDYDSLKNYQIYSCGAPEMIEAAQRDFTEQRELPETEFFSDAFSPAI